jgi:hypothetical protein
LHGAIFETKKIIEVGSGYSSCVMLDTLDRMKHQCDCYFIEPFPASLKKLTAGRKINIIEKKLQDVDMEIFKSLEENDIVFIDSSHVSKTGSDVNYIIHNILPAISKGVHIHFHDMFWPFEYPESWLKNGFNWNENYILRAFLQYNDSFEISCFLTYLWHHQYKQMATLLPDGVKNIGGALWIKKVK